MLKKIKKEQIPNDHLLVPFDVKLLFVNDSFDKIIEIILNRICDKNEVSSDITEKWNERAVKPM